MKIFAKERPLTPSWDLLGPSFGLLKKNFVPILYLSILPQLVLTLGLTLLPKHFDHALNTRETIGAIVTGFGILLSLLVYPGFILFVSRTAQKHSITTREAFTAGLKRFLPFLGLVIIVLVLTVVGFMFFIIPGLIVFRALYLAPYYLLDQGLNPIEAMKKSESESQPVSAWVWGTIGVTSILTLTASVIGKIPVLGTFIGLVITYSYIYGPALRYCEVAKLKTVNLKR